MDILEKIDYATKEKINESGIRNIRELAKTHKEAEIYFHQDLDGVASGIAIKDYLGRYGIKTVDTHVIQYGDTEYAVPKPKDKTLHVLVDFAHGKDAVMHIHTDHHDNQVGVSKGTSTSFVHTPSNAAYISSVLNKSDAFPPEDLQLISMVDSADFAKNNITPDQVMNAAFNIDSKISVSKNRMMMGLVTNKLILAYKSKAQFMEKLVMMANPSLVSMYNTTKYLAKKAGYKPGKEGFRTPEQLSAAMSTYVGNQRDKMREADNFSDIKTLGTGDSMQFGNIVVQYGSSALVSPKVLYDRYTVFKNHPDAVYLIMMWPLGLLQITKNPFKKMTQEVADIDLGALAQSVLEKSRSKLEGIDVSLEYVKQTFEKKADAESMGFTFKDFIALFEKQAKGIDGKQWWRDLVADIADKHYADLSLKQKAILRKVTVTAWDVIQAQSGGHKNITNISGLNFIGKGYVPIIKALAMDCAKELSKQQG